MAKLIWLIPLFPLLGALVNGLWGRQYIRDKAHVPAIVSTALALFFALLVVGAVVAAPQSTQVVLFDWVVAGPLNVQVGFLADPLSAIMLFVVAGVGFVIHIYSIGYMHGDPGYYRFFCYLNLFMFFMLVLVTANNYLLMFVGWEGVGLCSYLLIGFWFERQSAADAGKKAFVVNRVGDAGFLLGIFLIYATFGTFNYLEVFPRASDASTALLTAITLCLFVGAMGKSAQIPLHVWLPDAMEGPTPVSALIHAATMVTAGVYMVARSHVLYALAPVSAEFVATIGGLTAIFAASIGLVQNDIKRVLAYSTVSQLGYMFLGAGVGASLAAIFHLMTHAFFKGLLFLASGSVIHALSGEQDVRRMGGLRPALPRTAVLMWIGTIALIGFWPLSKDGILAAALEKGGAAADIVWAGGIAGAFLTGVYATRLMRLTFYGPKSTFADVHLHDTSHGEAPATMFWPVAALAAGALLSGLVAIGFGTRDQLASWLRNAAPTIEASVSGDVLTTALAWGAGLAGAGLVWWAYASPARLNAITSRLRAGAVVAENKFYWDAAYDRIAYLPAAFAATGLYRGVERWIVWGSIRLVAYVVRAFSRAATEAQTGVVRLYAATLVVGAAVLGAYFLGRASL